jgi:TetR/AcrR family transcriptional regulator, acrAB operon repressor
MNQATTQARRRARVRDTRATTADPRSAQTRAQLCAAFERVVIRDGYGAATVSGIAAEAGISRGAFYDHFTSPSAVALAVVESLYEAIAADTGRARSAGLSNLETSRYALERLASHMHDNSALYRGLLLSSTASGAVVLALQEKFAAESIPGVRAARPDLTARGVDQAAHVIAGAVLATMTWWLREDDPRAPSELAEELADLLPEWFTRPTPAAE